MHTHTLNCHIKYSTSKDILEHTNTLFKKYKTAITNKLLIYIIQMPTDIVYNYVIDHTGLITVLTIMVHYISLITYVNLY